MAIRKFELEAIARIINSEVKEYNNQIVKDTPLNVEDALHTLRASKDFKLHTAALQRASNIRQRLVAKDLIFDSNYRDYTTDDFDLEKYEVTLANNLANYLKRIEVAKVRLNYTYQNILDLATVSIIEFPANGPRIMRDLLGLPAKKD